LHSEEEISAGLTMLMLLQEMKFVKKPGCASVAFFTTPMKELTKMSGEMKRWQCSRSLGF
jgi:hypothetical protein